MNRKSYCLQVWSGRTYNKNDCPQAWPVVGIHSIFNESCLYSFFCIGLKLFRRGYDFLFVCLFVFVTGLLDLITFKVVVHMFEKPFRDLGELHMKDVNSETPSYLAFFSASN